MQQQLEAEHKRLEGLEAHWTEERELVTKILDLRAQLRAAGHKVDEKAADKTAPAKAAAGAAPKGKEFGETSGPRRRACGRDVA